MSRRAVDPVEKAFDLWADLMPDQKKQFHWSMKGYNMARKEAIAANGGVEPERVVPRVRQRKAKEPAMGALAGTVSRGHASDGSER